MGNSKILYGDVAPTGTVTVSSELATYTKKYLTTQGQRTKWRSNNIITYTTITIDLGAATSLEGIAAFNTNIVAGDTTFNFQTATDAAFTAGLTTDAMPKVTDSHIIGTWSNRYVRFVIVKASGTYIQVGKILLCTNAYEFEVNHRWGYRDWPQFNFFVNSRKDGTFSQTYINKARRLGLTFKGAGQTQYDHFEEATSKAEIALYNDRKSTIYLGRVKPENGNASETYFDRWSIDAVFQENPK